MTKRLTVLMLSLFLFVSCGDGGGEKNFFCQLSVFNGEDAVFENKSASFAEGETVLDILLAAVKEEKIQIEYSGIGATAYVMGIDNVYEFDEGPESGWIYYVNEEFIEESAGTYKVNDSDIIVWEYVTEK